MGFGGGGSSTPAEKPRSKPDEGTYAPREDHDPINTQLGLNDDGTAPRSLLNPGKPKPQNMIG